MPGHPRLYRRGATYYHRAAVPVDIRGTYPKTEETFSLRTTDHREAVRRVRVAAAEVDRRFDKHRQRLAQRAQPVLKELSEEQIKQIGEIYYAFRLREDEEVRIDGFRDEDSPMQQRFLRRFEDYAEAIEHEEVRNRYHYARGKDDSFFIDEVSEVLSWEDVSLNLDRASPSWRRVARELQAASIKATEAMRARNQGDVVETPASPITERHHASPLMSVTVEEWAKEKGRTSWVPKTEREHRVWMSHFIAVIGDRPIGDYGKAEARAFKALLLKLPANWNKFEGLKGLPIDKAAEKAQDLGIPPMSDKNVNKLLGYVGSFWTWAIDQYDDLSAHPFRGLKIKQRKTVREERDPFTVDELHAIFNAPLYTGCKSVSQWKQPGPLIPRDAGIFWVPLISLYTGARLGEVIQLYVGDVREENGIRFLDFNADGDDKRLKNANSKRQVPIHPDLIRMGLLDHVEKRRAKQQTRLFPELKMGEDGYYSSPFSKHFNRMLTSVGVKTRKNAFHSFRHCFEDACRDSDIPKELMDALQGHGATGMAARYGKGYLLEKLDEAMKRLRYRGLSIDHLL